MLSKPMMNSKPYDELWTPKEALTPLLPHIMHMQSKYAWECAVGSGALVSLLANENFKIFARRIDFLKEEPTAPYDWIITNPPYSLKAQFLKRANELGKPWAMLLPVTTLGARICQKELEDVQVVLMPKRIDFTGKKAPWFAVAWFCMGLNITGGNLIFP